MRSFLSEFGRSPIPIILAFILAATAATGAYSVLKGRKVEAGQAAASANASTAGMKSATDALKITVDTQAVTGRIDIVTKENHDAIAAAAGASEALGTDLHNTGLHALCLRGAYRLQPACVQLLDAGAGNAPQGN